MRALELTGVVKDYRGLRPLRIADFVVEEGERAAISGLDRQAAEVFVDLVNGALLPDAGVVRVLGRSTADITEGDDWLSWLDAFGILTQRAVLLESSSLAQNLALPLSLEIDPMPADLRATVDALAAEVDLPAERLDRPIGDAPPIVRLRAHLGQGAGARAARGAAGASDHHARPGRRPAVRRDGEAGRRGAPADGGRRHRGRRLRRRGGDARLQAQWRHRRAHVDARLAPLPSVALRRTRATAVVRYRRDAGPHRRRRLARDDARLRRDPWTRGRAEEGRSGRPHRPHHHARRADPRRPVDTTTSTLDAFRQAYCAALREEIQQPGNGRRGLLPGVRPLLDALAGRDDVRLALLTGNFRASAEIKLAAFDVWKYFTWGAFADDAIERDDLIAVAHARHETEHGHVIEPDAVVIIGDTPHDIRCARAGGAKAVAVATGNYDLEALRGHQPDALFADLTDTDAVLDALLRSSSTVRWNGPLYVKNPAADLVRGRRPGSIRRRERL